MDGYPFWYPCYVGWCPSKNGEISLQESDEICGPLMAELSAYLYFLVWVVGVDDYLVILLGPL